MFGGKFNHESRFFADGYELSGIENVSFAYNQSPSILKPLGTKDGLTVVSGPVNQTMSMSRVLTYQDPILNYTGEGSLSGSISYDDRNYGFESGYLTDYSLNCAVGSVPRVNANFQIATELKSGVDASLPSESHPIIDIPTQGSISITCDNSTTNRVIGFDYGVKCNRKAYLSIGEKNIKKVELIAPIEYNATVQIDVDDAFMENANNFFDDKQNKNLSLSIDGRSGSNIQTVNIPNASLVSENLQASSNGSLRLTLNYIGHIGASEQGSIEKSLSYVFDENANVLKTEAGDIPSSWMSGSGNIHEFLIGSEVQEIGSQAFRGCYNLNTDIFINSGVDVIGNSAFRDCSGFKSNLLFEKSDTLSINPFAFNSSSFVGDLILPNFITDIGASAFGNCKGFDGILRLPTGLQDVEAQTFINCDGLIGDINIPDSVAAVKNGAFARCSGFDGTLTLGSGFRFTFDNAFLNCNKLIGTLNIPDSAEYLNSSSFKGCSQLQEVYFGTGLHYIGSGCFDGCSSLTNVISFKENFTGGIGGTAFKNCKKIKGLTFESDSLSYIGQYAFENCDSLEGDLDLPMESGGDIYSHAFYNCKGLNGTLSLGSVGYIGNAAFRECSNIIGSLTIPSECETLDYACFNDAGFDGSLYFEDYQTSYTTNLNIEDYAFRNCGFKGDLVISGNERIRKIDHYAFENCKFSNQLVLPESIEIIGNSAFRGCSEFTGRLVVPSGIITSGLKGQCFRNTSKISGVYMDSPFSIVPFNNSNQFEGLGTEIGQNYVYVTSRYYDGWKQADIDGNNDGIIRGATLRRGNAKTTLYKTSDSGVEKSIAGSYIPGTLDPGGEWYSNKITPEVTLEIGQDVTGIGRRAFFNSDNIVGDLNIPENVIEIQTEAFSAIENGFGGQLSFGDEYKPSKLKEIDNYAFFGANFTGDLILPDSLTNLREGAFRSSKFSGSLKYSENPDFVVGSRAFMESSFTGEVRIPDANVDGSIRIETFRDCTGLNSLEIGIGTRYISSNAFDGCTGLSNVLDLTKNIRSLGVSAFKGCTNLAGVEFGGKLRTVNSEAFSGCYNMNGGFELNSNINTIGDYAFKDCSGLSYIKTKVPVANLGLDSFRIQSNPTSEKILYIDKNKVQDYRDQGALQGNSDYYDGNLIRRERENLLQTEYYNASYDVVDSGVFSVIPAYWKSGDGGHYVEVGDLVQEINTGAFMENQYLSGNVVIPPSVEKIENYAFKDCPNIQNYIFQEGVKSIDSRAFENNSSIKKMIFPNSLNRIGQYALNGCTSLEEVDIPNAETIGITWAMTKGCDSLRKVTIGRNTSPRKTSINGYSFRYCGKNVTNGDVLIDYSVDNVSSGSFGAQSAGSAVGYPWIQKLNLACREIDQDAFREQSNITDLTIRDGVKRIRERAFQDCSGLTRVSMVGGTYVHGGAFENCNNINYVRFGKFDNTLNYERRTLAGAFRYVGQNVTNGEVLIGSNVWKLRNNSFFGDYPWIKTAQIEPQIIEESCFRNQTNLETLTVNQNTTVLIERRAFENCTSLSGDFVSKASSLAIEEDAFKDCPLRDVYMNSFTGNISGSAFTSSMTGDFYIYEAELNGWTTGIGVADNGRDIYEWQNYPTPTPN